MTYGGYYAIITNMIYTSQNAAGTQPEIHTTENPALNWQQPQVDTEFARISSHAEPVAAPERLGGLNSDTVYAVGYEAVGHAIDQDGVQDITVAVGAARLPERFYMSGQAPERSLEEVATTQLAAAQVRMEQVHPGAIWQHAQEQQSRAYNSLLNDDDESDE